VEGSWRAPIRRACFLPIAARARRDPLS
jgi:hypothetical protein